MNTNDEKIDEYCNIFLRWSNVINIASKKMSRKELEESILDSLSGREFVCNEKSIVDIGTGGGLPGIPLAIALPEVQFFLVDANRKKCSFLRTLKQELSLKNVEIINERLENLFEYNCIISRAAFSLGKMGLLAEHVSKPGKLIIWSTPKAEMPLAEELGALGFRLLEKKQYVISGKGRAIFQFGNY